MPSVWAIADLHLSFGVPNKKMDLFGDRWKDHAEKIEEKWRFCVQEEDLVLIPGDISWAMRISEAAPDLAWIGRLPGTKVMIRGNHDYWWDSLLKIQPILPSSCHLIQNNSFFWEGIAIGGTRLWDVPGLNFSPYIDFKEGSKKPAEWTPDQIKENEKIYERELQRLETSLKKMPPRGTKKIVMTHYPPIGPHLEETAASKMMEKYGVEVVVFGHLHNIKQDIPLFGSKGGVRYYLTACDYLKDFTPLLIQSI